MGDGSSDGVLRDRAVLADVSNQLGKRRFVSIPGNSALNNAHGNQKNVEKETSKLELASKVSKGDENLERGKKGVSTVRVKRLGGSLSLGSGTKTMQSNVVSSEPRVPSEIKELKGSLDGNLRFIWGDALTQRVGEINDGLRDKAPNSSSFVFGGQFRKDGTTIAEITGNPIGGNAVEKAVATCVCENDEEGVNGGDLALNKSNSISRSLQSGSSGSKVLELEKFTGLNGDGGSNTSGVIGCSLQSESSGSKVFESEKFTGFNDDGGSNTTGGVGLLKTCSCSFCLKAAYIWSDLHYQDTKGRIAALKKSRKEVRSLIERNYSNGEFDKNGQGNSNDSTKLESDLTGQWRSLFLHSEGILVRENTQLQSSLLSLKDLKDNCKADLEINAVPSTSNNKCTSENSGDNV